MPYEIIKSTAGGKKGYRVKEKKKSGKIEYFSKEALPLERAKKQRTAIIISEIKRGKPEDYQKGGIVRNKRKIEPVQGRKKDYGDVVPAILEPGELVVPVKHAQTVKKYLKKKGVRLPGM